MGFFHSPFIRITLAVIGGAFYALLTYALILPLDVSSSVATLAAFFVYLLYLGSRLLLFSGVDSPYYSGRKKGPAPTPAGDDSFHRTAQWVGKFYHRHDLVLLIFLSLLAVAFIVSLAIDGFEGKPLGETIESFWNTLWPIP